MRGEEARSVLLRHKLATAARSGLGKDFYLPGEYNSPNLWKRIIASVASTHHRQTRSSIPTSGPSTIDCEFWQQVVKKRYVSTANRPGSSRSYPNGTSSCPRALWQPADRQIHTLALITAANDDRCGYTASGVTSTPTESGVLQWVVERDDGGRDDLAGICVEGLKHGEAEGESPSAARTRPNISRRSAFVTAPIWTMIHLQLWSSARPGELYHADLRRSPKSPANPREVAVCAGSTCPTRTRTEHHGKERVVLLGPQAQAILQPCCVPTPRMPISISPSEGERGFRRSGEQ